MANNTNELAGIFSAFGGAASSAASNSASSAYQKTLEINQALQVLDQERDFKRQLKRDAVNEYNQGQEIIRDSNVKAKDYIDNTLKTLENELKNNDFTTEELATKESIYIQNINDQEYKGDQSIYGKTAISAIQSLVRGEGEEKRILDGLNLLEQTGNELYKKSIRQGNYSSSNQDDYYSLVDNARTYQKNATDSNNAAAVTSVTNFMDDLSQREYVRGVLEKYDVSTFDPENVEGTAFLQLDKTVGPAEAVAIQDVAELYRTNNIKEAFAAIKTMQSAKNTDRTNINSGVTAGMKQVNKVLKSDIDNMVKNIKDFDELIPKSFKGDNLYFNNVSNYTSSEGMSADNQYMALFTAEKADLDEGVRLFTMQKDEHMMDETKKIAKIIASLGPVGKEYYLAGYLSQGDNDKEGEFVWNTEGGETSGMYYKQFKDGKLKIINPYDKLGSVKWDKGRIKRSRQLLAKNFTPEGVLKKTEDTDFDVNFESSLAFFQKYGAIFEAKTQNPYSREARGIADRKKELENRPKVTKAMQKVQKEAVLTKKFNKFKENSPDMKPEDFIKFADANKLNNDERDYIILLLMKESKGEE